MATDRKVCPKCERRLTRERFSAAPDRADGLRAYCRECEAAARERRRQALLAERTLAAVPDRAAPYADALGETLAGLGRPDPATLKLAQDLAAALDARDPQDAHALVQLGPKWLAVLRDLRATAGIRAEGVQSRLEAM